MAPPDPPVDDAPIPTYRIDLSLPPSERYVQLATDFAPKMKAMTPLLDEVLQIMIPWRWARRLIEFLAWILLWRVHSKEETEELKGISKASGVDMYFLVALNVLLDTLLGCTSGGVMTSLGKTKEGAEKRMMHFRTLDWGMDQLRDVIVVLEFIRSEDKDPEKVVGRSITYAGFVGILTGVRENLSISLNFRPIHTCSTFSLRWHQLLVLLGFRPSVCSLIRTAIIPSPPIRRANPVLLEELIQVFPNIRCAPCYLVFSDGTTTAVLERDLIGATIRTSEEFIIITNNDTKSQDPDHISNTQKEKSWITGLDTWIEESADRRTCVCKKWASLKKTQATKMFSAGAKPEDLAKGGWASVMEATLRNWLRVTPVMNECTHFMCIMDPQKGTIRFLERGVFVASDPDSEERFSVFV